VYTDYFVVNVTVNELSLVKPLHRTSYPAWE
jgi:hypothetical protein